MEPQNNESWTNEEDEILLYFYSIIGPKWVEIAKKLPGRSGNNVKNRWYKHLCKKYSKKNEMKITATVSKDKNQLMYENEIYSCPSKKDKFDKIYEQYYSISALLI